MVDSVIEPRFDNINRSTARARNDSILLNIVRASHNVPLNFVTFSKVNGSTTASANAAAPQFFVGPFYPLTVPLNPAGSTFGIVNPPAGQRAFQVSKDTLGGSTSANNNFEISILETKDFYSALLKPVDLVNLNFFTRQGYPRELLFWLFVESIRETVMGRTVEFLNDPEEPNSCQRTREGERCFRHLIDVAIASGLTVESRVEAGAAGTKGQKVYARLCFDRVLAQRARRDYDPEIFKFLLAAPESGHHPRCKADPWPHQSATAKKGADGKGADADVTDTLTFNLAGTRLGTASYEIIPRSTFGIYQFLGRILALNLQNEVRLRGPHVQREDPRILGVTREAGVEGCFADVTFEGEFVCVPRQGAENTKRIFSLLAQLVALNTQIGDLAITPTVRLAQ